MTYRAFGLRRVMTLVGLVGVAAALAGCGRTLVFAERDGVNLAVRANPSGTPPLSVNFGLDRVVATIVPPVGQQRDGKPVGEAVSMFAGFQVDAPNIALDKALNVDLTINTQFASGAAAVSVASNPDVVAKIVAVRDVTFSAATSSRQLEAWLSPDGTPSTNRIGKLQAWLNRRVNPNIPAALILDGAQYEPLRLAALQDATLMREPK